MPTRTRTMPIKAVKTDKFAVLDVFDALPPEEEEEEEYDEDLPPLEDREAGVEESKEEEEEVVVDDGWKKTPDRPIKKRKCPGAPKRLEDYAQPSFYHALPVQKVPKFPELPAPKKTSDVGGDGAAAWTTRSSSMGLPLGKVFSMRPQGASKKPLPLFFRACI